MGDAACTDLDPTVTGALAGVVSGKWALEARVKVVEDCCSVCPMVEECAGLRRGSAGVWGGVIYPYNDDVWGARRTVRDRAAMHDECVAWAESGLAVSEVAAKVGVREWQVLEALRAAELRAAGVLADRGPAAHGVLSEQDLFRKMC